MRYFLLAGEASGDNLGALLISEIGKLDPGAEFAFWGGDGMRAAAGGLSPKQHLRQLAFMGFVEVVSNLRTILRLVASAKRDIEDFAPDVLVCIDYPGFNLRIAKWAKGRGTRVDFYVSPQIWAWRQSRVHKIVAATDRVLCVLPFERDFYAGYGYDVDYVGHPLPKRVDAHPRPERLTVNYPGGQLPADGPVLALLPGSRRQEVAALLDVMMAGVTGFAARRKTAPGALPYRVVIAAAPVLEDGFLIALCARHGIGYVRSAYDLLGVAELACVTSGSATLETALFGVPQVVCYRGSAISVAIARRLVRVDYIALPNLILGEAVVPELIQEEANPEAIAAALEALSDGPARQRARAGYGRLREALEPYDAAAAAAHLIVADARAAEASTARTTSP